MSLTPLGTPHFRQFAVWVAVGFASTLIHLVAVVSLVEVIGVHSLPANGLAFTLANVFSYFANARWAFRTAWSASSYWRFLLVSLLGLAIALIGSTLAQFRQGHYLTGVAVSMVVIPFLTYLAHRLWTWRGAT